MATYSYPHVEDYIEIISGYRKPDGSSISNIWLSPTPLLSLARYDVKILESFGEQSFVKNTAYTDKQAALAYSIVLKYERQLNKHDIDIAPIKDKAAYRTAIREIDRSTRVWADGEFIKLRFPYNNELIEAIRAESKISEGAIYFERSEKVWLADLTEYNVNWCYAFAQAHNFVVDSSLQKIMDQLLEVEQQGYSIRLSADNDQLHIVNGHSELCDYITTHVGGLSTDNLLRAVDYAPIVGYSVEPVIEEVIVQAYGRRFWTLCANREMKANNDLAPELLAEVVRYAKETNRFPIYIYEPDLSDRLGTAIAGYFEKDQVTCLDKKEAITEHTRVVHTRKIPKVSIDNIPLLISSAGMMYGGDRQMWIQTAEKIVYFAQDVYNKSNQGKDICKLD